MTSAIQKSPSEDISSQANPGNTNTNDEKMVAGRKVSARKASPPQSPHRSRDLSPMEQKSPMNTPKSPIHSLSPSGRLSLGAKSPMSTPKSPIHSLSPSGRLSLGSGPMSNQGSPVPPSSRAQRASATAPVVGQHNRTSSLVGFDPLLDEAMVVSAASSSKEAAVAAAPTTPTGLSESHHKIAAIAPNLSNLTLSPLSPPKEQVVRNQLEVRTDLEGELQKLAQEVVAQSPNSKSKDKEKSLSKPKFGRASSATPKTNLTPPLQFGSSSHNNKMLKEPTSAPHRKMPWQRHHRSMSLEMPGSVPDILPLQDSSDNNNGAQNTNTTLQGVHHPMMQDLYDVVRTQDALAIPSLARPAPTSFLTGREIVRTSELDPSPFQMELPTVDQTLVNARVTQFVELYRKEDMNFDLNMSLVGKQRLELQGFVSLNKVPANLTEAHKPLVESLLDCADDVTVATFLESTNPQSADTRREVVILERQMQFIVVFRGTTAEQTGKTPLFKKAKAVPLERLDPSDDPDCKVYSAIKEGYLDLERRVFAALDKLMDQNPFCDVIFTGHSFGGAMATLGAYRYALNRPVVRVCCQTFGSPKVGNRRFRQQANSLPNLKVVRAEFANDTKILVPSDGAHVGHSIVIAKNAENNKAPTAIAYKFDDDHDARKQHYNPKPIFSAWKKERDITSYVHSLEEMHRGKSKWVTDFVGEEGTGVRGTDNEQRQVV